MQRPVLVADDDELVARGACVQSAARVTGQSITAVQEAWELGARTMTDPEVGADVAAAVRAAYASAASAPRL